jgi:putative SOS response-associated peptidase YedK
MAPRKKPQGFRLVSPKNNSRFLMRVFGLCGGVEGDVLNTFTIITTVPNALMRRIHNRYASRL